jgi:hypothetical protein
MKNEDEGRLWEVTLMASVFANRPSLTKLVRVRAWTGAGAELKAVELNPDWRPVVRHTKIVEQPLKRR